MFLSASMYQELPLFAAMKTLVNSLAVSRIDCCNACLSGSPASTINKLQGVLNAKLIYGSGNKYDHMTPLLRDKPYFQRSPEKVTFMLCLFTFKAIIQSCAAINCGFLYLCATIAATARHISVPRTRIKFGKRIFAVAGQSAWNKVPQNIRQADFIATFK